MVFSRQWNLDGNDESHLRRKRDSRRRQLRLELLEDRRVLTGELAELSYQFFALNPDGSTGRNLDPNPNDSVLQANVYVGEKFVVRTLAKDLRQPNPQGVFSVYTDLNYTNVDGSASEKIQIQWGEYNLITIGDEALAGSFRLQYGNETTAAIPLVVETDPNGAQEINPVATAGNIQAAIEALPSVGLGNVIVTTKVSSRYNVMFRKDLARTDIPDPVVVNNLVNTGGANPMSVQVQATGTTNASAESAFVLESAINRSPSVNPSYAFSNGGGKGFFEDLTSTTPGKRVLREVGGVSDVTSVPSAVASNFLAANDLTFVAAQAGQVQLEASLPVLPTPPQPGLGILLFGSGFSNFLTASEVILPTALITIMDGIVAVNDQTTVNEDSSTNVLNVLANDVDPTGTSRSIVSVSQPSTGGSVSIAASGSELVFTPAANFFGTAVSTYTVRNNLGFEAVGSVTWNVAPVNDPPMLNSVSNLSVALNASAQSVALTGISAGPGESQTLQVRVTSSNPNLIPTPTVTYQSPDQNGTLTVTPAPNRSGTSIITVTVEDQGGLQTSRTFSVIVSAQPGDFQNPSNAYDVDNDGFVSALDVLNIINLLNANDASTSVSILTSAPPFYDVDGDDFVTPLDALKVTDHLNFGGPFNGAAGTAELAIGFFGLDGTNLDPNPNDSIQEALVIPGQQFIVRTFAKDLRNDPKGVYSVYSNLDFINVDGSAGAKLLYGQLEPSQDYRNAPNGQLLDLTSTTPGMRRLENVGSFSSLTSIEPNLAGTFRRVHDVLFTAQSTGDVQITHSAASTATEKLGVALFASTGQYVPSSSIIFPTAKVSIREGLVAVNDDTIVHEDSTANVLNVLANDLDPSGTSRSIVSVSQPSTGGSVSIAASGSELVFTPAANFFGTAVSTYTVRNNLGFEAVGSVTWNVAPVNDPPMLNSVSNLSVALNASAQSVALTGISAGPGESQTLQVRVTSSNPNLIPTPTVTYQSPDQNGTLTVTPAPNRSGTSIITVTVEDQGGLQTSRTFSVIVSAQPGDFQNPSNAYDVDNDGFVSALDVLNINNLLNANNASTSVSILTSAPPFYDVDGDDFVTPLDALQVTDYINFGGPFNGPAGTAELAIGFFALDGTNLDPNPNDSIQEALVIPGQQFIVRTFAKDLRNDPKGVYSVYSNLDFINVNGSADARILYGRMETAQDYRNAPNGQLLDLTSTNPGMRRLENVGSFTNRTSTEPNTEGTFQRVHDVLFTAQSTGDVQITHSASSTGTEKLGVALFASSGQYVPSSSIIFPTAKVTIREGLVAVNDNFTVVEDSQFIPLNVLANDFESRGNAISVVAVSQPTGGVVSISSSGLSLRFTPAPNFFGVTSFTYTIQDSVGERSIGTVTVQVMPTNDNPTLDSVVDVIVARNAPVQTVPLTGISAGPGETQALNISVTSSNPALIPLPTISYLDPSATGSLQFTPSTNRYGSSEITVSVEETDGSMVVRTFTITVSAPSGGYQNLVNPLDVNEDSFVSPIDYLIVVNLLNAKGPATSVVGLTGPGPFYDVDGDDFVTPRDSLRIADFLNASSSVSNPSPMVKMQYGFFAIDGRNLDPNPDDEKAEAVVLLGEQFIVRTFIQDLRADARGIYSVYSDFNYINKDKSAAEKLAFEFTSSSQMYSFGESNEFIDTTSPVPGKRVLREVGRFSSLIDFQPGDASSSLVAYDTRFTAQELGVIDVFQTLSNSAISQLGISVLGGNGQYLTLEKVSLPSGTITIHEGVGVLSSTSHWTSPSSPTKSNFVVDALKSGFVDAWVDFNRDGDWQDPADRVLSRIAVTAGKNIIPFTVPAGMPLGSMNARFLLTQDGADTATDILASGEYSNDVSITLEGGSLASPTLRVDELGAHEITIANGLVVIKVAGAIVWSVPANELSKLTSVNRSGEVVAELRDFSSAFPGAILYNQDTSTVELKVSTENLNLVTYGTENLVGVQTIDLRQTGSNVLVVQPEQVAELNSEKRLQVILNQDDSLSTSSSWAAQVGRIENGVWVQPYSSVNLVTGVVKTLEVVSERPWRNEVLRLDSDGDRSISPLDVLLLINGVNTAIFPGGRLPARTPTNGSGFYDTDGDNFLGPLDVLQVINHVNLTRNGEGEQSKANDMFFSVLGGLVDAEEWLARRHGRNQTRL